MALSSKAEIGWLADKYNRVVCLEEFISEHAVQYTEYPTLARQNATVQHSSDMKQETH